MKPAVLLVDNDLAFRTHVAEILSSQGYEVFEASSPEVAEPILDGNQIDLLTIDCPSLDRNSVDVLEYFTKKHARSKSVVLTQADSSQIDALTKKTSIDLILLKPTLPEELAHKISRLLSLDGKTPVTEFDSYSIKEAPKPFSQLNNTNNTDNSEQSELSKLHDNYGLRIPKILFEIGQSLLEAQAKPETSKPLKIAHRLVHTLHGTSGSLGFGTIGTLSSAMEKVLLDLVETRRIMSSPPSELPGDKQEDNEQSENLSTLLSNINPSSLTSVLVVDDDTEFLLGVVAMGNENLIQVHTAVNNAQATAIARKHTINAAIIDVYLSKGENPFEIAKNLRSLDGLQDLPIAFISADTSIPTRIAAIHAGASQFLDKPLDSGSFSAAVRRLAPLETADHSSVLVVDDDVTFLKTISIILKSEGLKVESLSDPTQILDVLKKTRPDIVLLDVAMPDISGIDVCRILRSEKQWCDLPVLFMTTKTGQDILLQCFEAGGDDYIEKPVLKEELLARINVRMERVRFFRERADRDGLTGLLTRRAFIERFRMQLSEGKRSQKPISLCLIDLDNFKNVNDSYGHLAGDRVLAWIGQLLNTRFRGMDIRCRWGGEELLVSFFNEEVETSKMILNRALNEFREMVFTGDHHESFQVTFSAGIASFPESGESLDTLFKTADQKLFTAKNNGRNRIEI